ncbi:hypothetical protein HDU85_006693 [Gaertneriomyces sp. JEL0708]|nr:hypothetical protein HDU85_006693 [Gaertneriomyces sp. JEL0708]
MEREENREPRLAVLVRLRRQKAELDVAPFGVFAALALTRCVRDNVTSSAAQSYHGYHSRFLTKTRISLPPASSAASLGLSSVATSKVDICIGESQLAAFGQGQPSLARAVRRGEGVQNVVPKGGPVFVRNRESRGPLHAAEKGWHHCKNR